ncbi:MAG: hypothetical protein WAW96_04920 [Alphaproteobacteria bacterium]
MPCRVAFCVLLVLAGASMPAGALEFALEGNGEDCAECNWIQATGPIEPGDARKLDDFITATATHVTNVRFFSPGGELHAALELGAYLRERAFDTYVTDADYVHPGAIGMVHSMQEAACYSACVYAFAGGVHRHADDKVLGIHQFAVDGAPPPDIDPTSAAVNVSITRWLDNYVTEMGVDPHLVSMASDISNESPVRLLDAAELRALNLDNSGTWN